MEKDTKKTQIPMDNSLSTLTKPNRSSYIILWVIAFFIIAALVWADNADIDEVTRGNGTVIS